MLFLKPYILFCGTGTYSLVQNFQSTGLDTFQKGMSIDPGSMFTLYLFLYVIVFIVTIFFSIGAATSLNKKFGLIVSFLWLLPGFLSVFGVDLVPGDVPDSYKMNAGSQYVGEVTSSLYNVILAFIFGWSFFTLIVHSFKIKQKFKDIYDHVWYTLGLSVVVFFVLDSNSAYYQTQLSESEKNISEIVKIATSQLKATQVVCAKETDYLLKNGIEEEFCEWVNYASREYFRIEEAKVFTRNFISEEELRKVVPIHVSKDIAKYNEVICSSSYKKSYCSMLNFEFDRFRTNYNLDQNMYALALEPLNKALVYFWSQTVKNYDKLHPAQNIPNIKWIFYMVLGFLAGGKVANASRSLAGEPKPVFRFMVKNFYYRTRKILTILKSIITVIGNKLYTLARIVIRRVVNLFQFIMSRLIWQNPLAIIKNWFS